MASTTDMAPATTRKSSNAGSRSSAKTREQELEAQVAQLQSDLKSITETLRKLTGERPVKSATLQRRNSASSSVAARTWWKRPRTRPASTSNNSRIPSGKNPSPRWPPRWVSVSYWLC